MNTRPFGVTAAQFFFFWAEGRDLLHFRSIDPYGIVVCKYPSFTPTMPS
jgi:hypothetical protein